MTQRQKLLAKNLGKYKTMEETMIQSKYAPSSARQQQEILKGKGFQELLNIKLPDEKLLDRQAEALDATKWNDFTGERELDFPTILKAIDSAHKLKGRNKDGINVQGDLNMSVTIVRHAVE